MFACTLLAVDVARESEVFRAGLPREKMLDTRGSLAAIRRAGVQIGAQVRQRIEPVLGGREEDGIDVDLARSPLVYDPLP